MIESYFFIVLIWTLFFVGLKFLKDFTFTIIMSLLIMTIGFYGLAGGLGMTELIKAISYGHLFIGLWLSIKSSIKLVKETKSKINKQNNKDGRKDKRQ